MKHHRSLLRYDNDELSRGAAALDASRRQSTQQTASESAAKKSVAAQIGSIGRGAVKPLHFFSCMLRGVRANANEHARVAASPICGPPTFGEAWTETESVRRSRTERPVEHNDSRHSSKGIRRRVAHCVWQSCIHANCGAPVCTIN